MTQHPSPTPSRARFAGLDGLRAVAVALVVVYHLFPGWGLRSGLVGVDVFFVISGFLITSLLLRERAATGRIALIAFWRRRARRLLPALAVALTVCATWAWLIGGDVLVRVGRQVLGALTFSYNWISLSGGSDYFQAGSPELFRNVWSLAVEEQFYVLWPLLLPLLLLVRRPWARMLVAITAAAGSAVWMTVLVARGASLTRAYFGTDSHAFGLLLGVALAVGLERVFASPPAWLSTRRAQLGGLFVGVAALVALVAVATSPGAQDAPTFAATLAGASVLSGIVMVAGAVPGSWIGPALDVAPLRWIGDRSYGIYLWHWPLYVLLVAMSDSTAASDTVPAWIGAMALALTIVFAGLSYRFVEQPVRRLGFRATARRAGAWLAGTPGMRLRAAGLLLAGAVVVAGTTAAIAVAPAETSGQSAVQAGQRALGITPAPRPPLLPDTVAATPSATPTVVDGSQIDAIGDSVMLASAPALMQRYPGIRIDAKVSRSMWTAPGIVRGLADHHDLRRWVVVGLGTNGAIDPATLDQVVDTLGPHRSLVLVTASAPRSWIPGVNAALRTYAGTHSDVELADWDAAIAPHEDLLAGDHIHPGDAGGRIYAQTVAEAIARLQLRLAQQHEHMILRVQQLAA